MACNSSQSSGLRIATFNMHGFNNSWHYLQHLSKSCDIIFIQEHWLANSKLHYLDSINDEFIMHAKSGMDAASDDRILTGRPYGGVAVMWRKSLCNNVSLCKHDAEGSYFCENCN
jgi:exonuclease III